jgi:hypothetical protein
MPIRISFYGKLCAPCVDGGFWLSRILTLCPTGSQVEPSSICVTQFWPTPRELPLSAKMKYHGIGRLTVPTSDPKTESCRYRLPTPIATTVSVSSAMAYGPAALPNIPLFLLSPHSPIHPK